jgi:hypothetical protein
MSNKGLRLLDFLPQRKFSWWSAFGGPQCIQLATCISSGTLWSRNCQILPSAEASCALYCHCGSMAATVEIQATSAILLLCASQWRRRKWVMQTAEPAVCAEEEEQVQWWIWAVVHFCSPGLYLFHFRYLSEASVSGSNNHILSGYIQGLA